MSEVTEELVLPMSKIPPMVRDPKTLIIFSKPKVGKTSLLSTLPNCLIIDCEDGSDYIEGLKIKITSVSDIKKIVDMVIAAGKPYDYIALDTITKLEDMCIPYAEWLYSQTSMGATWFTKGKATYKSIINLPNGSGYPWLRESFQRTIALLAPACSRIILIGHVKDTMLEKNGVEFNALELDLTGKIKRTTAMAADAIGYLSRVGDKNVLSFKTTDEVGCGARPEHLRNQEIVVSEFIDGVYTTHWDKIYLDPVTDRTPPAEL